MGLVSSGVGLVSGLNTSAIIGALLTYDQAPVTVLQDDVANDNAQVQDFQGFSTQLTSLQTISKALGKTSTFQASTATSSDPSVLSATTTAGATLGSFQFQVSQLVSTQQAVSSGFSDPNTARVGAGTLTLSLGGGELTNPTTLNSLNGGNGVDRGQFKVTDSSGHTATIDISNAITLDDVAKDINTATGINIKATVGAAGLVLQDQAGGTGTLSVNDIGNGDTAAGLGIVGQADSNGTLTGTPLDAISESTQLSDLNGGNGITTSGVAGNGDFRVLVGDGTTFDVSLNGAKTVGDAINDINRDSGGKLTASIGTDGQGIQLTDNTGGGGPIVVANLYSNAAQELGITVDSADGSYTGQSLVSPLDSVPLSQLNGGQGLKLGTINVIDRAGNTDSIDLGSAGTVQQVIADINQQGAGSVKASLNSAQDGIQIQDISGGSGNLNITDGDATNSATALGINGSFTLSQTTVDGGDLHRQFISGDTLLSGYDGGQGVPQGQFTITNSAGATSTIHITPSAVTLQDVISDINSQNIGVTASINTTGDGLLLTDTAGGAGKLTVKDVNSTTAQNLNIAGTATGTTIDGSFTKTITLDQNDTLNTVVAKINAAGAGVTASVINDGSASDPYRLSITANNSGLDGRFTFDAGSTGLKTSNLVQAQDAAVFVGGQGSAQPLLVTSSKNQITNLINGVTISLNGASTSPVTLNIAQDSSGIVTQLQSFVTGFNTLVGQLSSATGFNTSTNTGGLLLGNSTAEEIQTQLYAGLTGAVATTGQYRTLADIGLTIGQDGTLTFDSSTFQAAIAADPTGVENLFTQATSGAGTLITNDIEQLIDPTTGAITLQNQDLATQTQQFNERISELNAVISAKQQMLENEFAHMETTLSTLDSQQAALSTLSSSTATAKSSTSNISSIGNNLGSGASSSSNTSSSSGSSSNSTSNNSGSATSG